MTTRTQRACALGARKAGTLLACALAALAFAISTARAQTATPKEDAKPATPAASDAFVGAWQARTASGLRVATLTLVSDGAAGYGGAVVGYEYDRPLDFDKPSEGPPPKVAMRWGSLLKDARLEGQTLTFKITLRHPKPPPGMPASMDVNAEVRFSGGDAAELRLSHPRKPEPLVMKMTRE